MEIIFHPAGDFDRDPPRQDHFGLVRNKTRSRDDDFIARVQQGGHYQVERF